MHVNIEAMVNYDFLEILLLGYTSYKKYYSDFLYRKALEAKSNHIGYEEFFDGLNEALNKLKFERNDIFNRRFYELNINRLSEIEYANGVYHYIDLNNIENIDIKLELFSVNLYGLTHGKFSGELYERDFKIIEGAIRTAEKVVSQKDTSQIDSQNDIKRKRMFPEYLLHTKRELLALRLKEEFSIEYGKSIRLLLQAFQDHDPPLITLENRQKKALLKAMEEYFGRSLGKYQSVFCYEINGGDKPDLDAIKSRLNFILRNL